MNRKYNEIWKFLREFNLPYCSLYDLGYTSLGSTLDTLPNPYLRNLQSTSEIKYYPAYMLCDYRQERAGRVKSLISLDTKEVNDSFNQLSVNDACIIAIGDEILNGSINDMNIHFASKLFDLNGIELKKVIILRDNINDIAKVLLQVSQEYDLIITSGGIGPTHDDMTLEAISNAFNVKLEVNQEMLDVITQVNDSYTRNNPIKILNNDIKQQLIK